jgi:hypothetical protein
MKKIKILKTLVLSGKKYEAGSVIDVEEKVYKNLIENKFPFEDINE